MKPLFVSFWLFDRHLEWNPGHLILDDIAPIKTDGDIDRLENAIAENFTFESRPLVSINSWRRLEDDAS